MVNMPTGEGQRRLREIENAYRDKHVAANAAFRRQFDALLAKHGLEFNSLADIHELSQEFYEDLRPLQAAHLATINAAMGDRGRQVRTVPTRAIRIN